jgi:hypothetical protein
VTTKSGASRPSPPAAADAALRSVHTSNLPALFERLHISLVVSTYQAGKVILHLWTEGSLVHLVFGVLIRGSDRWGKKCLSEFEQQQIRSLRERLKLDEQEVSMSEPSIPVPTRRSAASAA